MTLKRKLVLMMATLLASKHAVAASIATAATVAVVAPAIGFDPLTWFFSGIGAVAARLKIIETSRQVAIANGIISVVLGGLGSPYALALVMKFDYPQPPIYLCAFLLALLWPVIWDKLVALWDKKVAS